MNRSMNKNKNVNVNNKHTLLLLLNLVSWSTVGSSFLWHFAVWVMLETRSLRTWGWRWKKDEEDEKKEQTRRTKGKTSQRIGNWRRGTVVVVVVVVGVLTCKRAEGVCRSRVFQSKVWGIGEYGAVWGSSSSGNSKKSSSKKWVAVKWEQWL